MYKDNNFLGTLNGCGCNSDNYGCGIMKGDTWGIEGHPLAMVYSPLQVWGELYDHETALCQGTLFGELDLPFLGSGNNSKKNGCGNENGCGCNMNRYGYRGGIKNG